MTFDKFNGFLQTMDAVGRQQQAAYKAGVDLAGFTDDFYGVINDLLKALYGAENHEWISWYMCENDFGRGKLEATEHGKPICYDARSLWEYVEREG